MSIHDDKNRGFVLSLKEQWDDDTALELFRMNRGFTGIMVRRYCLNPADVDDYWQMAYLALTDSVRAFDSEKDIFFLSYYKVYLTKYFYNFNFKNQFPFSNNNEDYRDFITGKKSIDLNRFSSIDNYDIEFVDYVIDDERIWNLISEILDDKNYYVIYSYFHDGKNLAEIGRSLGIGRERVRLRKDRSMEKLKKNSKIRDLARECGLEVT